MPPWASSRTCPWSMCRRKSRALRKNIRDLDDRIVKLREKQLVAPKDGMLPGYLTDTVDSLSKDVEETKKKIDLNREEIKQAKGEVLEALQKAGVQLSPEQVDLLARQRAVRRPRALGGGVQFGQADRPSNSVSCMTASGENIGAARKYFAMHAALFALLVHAQDGLIAKIDNQYLPKLTAIEARHSRRARETAELLKAENRDGSEARAGRQSREPEAWRKRPPRATGAICCSSVSRLPRRASAPTHDLRIADNTYETVEASFQLKILMRDSAASFEAIQSWRRRPSIRSSAMRN